MATDTLKVVQPSLQWTFCYFSNIFITQKRKPVLLSHLPTTSPSPWALASYVLIICLYRFDHWYILHGINNDGHFGYFHILTIVCNATVNACIQVFVSVNIFFFFFLDIYLRVKLLNHIVTLFTCLRKCQSFPEVAALFFFFFLHSSHTLLEIM